MTGKKKQFRTNSQLHSALQEEDLYIHKSHPGVLCPACSDATLQIKMREKKKKRTTTMFQGSGLGHVFICQLYSLHLYLL